MFNELKELMVWCRSNGVYHIEVPYCFNNDMGGQEGGTFKADIQMLEEVEEKQQKPIIVRDEFVQESPDYSFPQYEEILPFKEAEEVSE